MILTSTQARIEGCWITAYRGTVQGETWKELLRHAEEIGANAVLNTCFDDALDVNTLFHGAAVVIEPLPSRAATAVAPPTYETKSQRDPGLAHD
jgi:uncharacterized protein YbjQ (UPF0145 family)